MKHVEVELRGGLGNQLFIAATGYALSTKLGCPLVLNLNQYTEWNYRKYSLDSFSIPNSLQINSTPNSKKVWQLTKLPNWRSKKDFFQERSFDFDNRFELLSSPKYLKGYFQSWKYFSTVEEEIKSIFDINLENSLQRQIQMDIGRNYNAIHIRLGDYLLPHNQVYHGVLARDYFLESIEIMKGSKFANLPLVLFSDMPEKVDKIILRRVDYVVKPDLERNEFLDLAAMAKSNFSIMSNSSFSWWAAYLGNSDQKSVLAPSPWFKSFGNSSSDLLLPNWQTLTAAKHFSD